MTLLIVISIVEALIICAGAYKVLRTKYDGSMVVTHTEEKRLFSLEVDTDPDVLDHKRQIVLKVKNLSDS